MERTRSVRVERARPLLGTIVALRVDGPAARIETAIEAAFEAIDAVQRAMSFHDPASELSRLNREVFGAAQTVGAGTWRVLRASLALARASDGRFDPCIGARLVRSDHLPAPVDAPRPDADANWRDVELLPGRRVRFRKPLWLDFGGIAKGHAVDRAVAALQVHGMDAGVVNAGGDLRVFGDAEEIIRVRDPARPAIAHPLLRLRDGAAATSSGYFSANAQGSALLDPRDGANLGTAASATVCAPRTIWADALTKLVLIDAEAVRPLLRRLHAQAALLDRDGRLRRFA